MLKVKITEREVLISVMGCQKIGYRVAPSLEKCLGYAVCYTASKTYGWKSDIYTNGSMAVSVGYEPCGENYFSGEELAQWEAEASKAIGMSTDKDSREERMGKVRNSFYKELYRKIYNAYVVK